MNNFDVVLQQGGLMELQSLEELDRKRHDQLETKSEATLSKLDLKASARARSEYNKGLQSLNKNDVENAISSLTKAIALYPDFVAAHNALGCAYFNRKQTDLARQEFSQAIALDDHLSSSYLNLGRAQLALGETAAAQTSLEKASSIAPLDANLLSALTYVEFLNHDYPAAVRTAQRAHAHNHPGSAIVHYFSAAAWQAQNNLDQTQAELQTFLVEDPKSTFADQARQTLAKLASLDKDAPPTPSSVSVSFDSGGSPPSVRGQQVLQDFREKQQIAEAEAAGPECSSCAVDEPRQPDVAAPNVAAASPRHASSGFAFHAQAEEVALFFTATDRGKSVTDLTQQDVLLRDDQKPPASILAFRNQSGLPLRLGLLVDTSVSITDRFAFEQKAASKFLAEVLTGENDLGFVAGFSNSVVLVQDFTRDLEKISRGLNQLVPVGGTSLWDAVTFGADKLAEVHEDRPVARVLVVISDGEDNSSRATLKQAIDQVERDEVVVYTVSTRNSDPTNDDDLTGNHAMRVLAEFTGGAAFFPGSADRLSHGLAQLQQVIRSRYLISYKPALFQHDGRYRAIAISAKKSGRKLKVDARKGYYAAANSATPPQF